MADDQASEGGGRAVPRPRLPDRPPAAPVATTPEADAAPLDLTALQSGTPQWLLDAKAAAAAMKARHERPAGLAHGRWLGDFLDQETPSGLLAREEQVLLAAIAGEMAGFPAGLAETVAMGELSSLFYMASYQPEELSGEPTFKLAVELMAWALGGGAPGPLGQLPLEPPDDLRQRIEARGAAVRDLLLDVLPRIVRSDLDRPSGEYRRLPADLAKLLSDADEPEPLQIRLAFIAALTCLRREQWRLVEERQPIRAGFVRFLALGGDGLAPLHEKGVQIVSAAITGKLDLEGAKVAVPLAFYGCRFDSDIELGFARLHSLSLRSCRLAGLVGQGCRVEGSVGLGEGMRCDGAILLGGCRIGGDLDCSDGTILNRPGRNAGSYPGMALSCFGGEITGDVYLGKRVGQDSELPYDEGFVAEGEVNLQSTKVGGSVYLSGGHFDNAAPAKSDLTFEWTARAEDAINLTSARISGVLWLGPHSRNAFARATIRGSLNLMGCHAHELLDHPTAWPRPAVANMLEPAGARLPAYIYLDGFTFDRLTGRGRYDAASLKRWLRRSPPDHLGSNFRPQPFTHLQAVLRAMGHEGRAREIAKFRESYRRWILLAAAWQWLHRLRAQSFRRYLENHFRVNLPSMAESDIQRFVGPAYVLALALMPLVALLMLPWSLVRTAWLGLEWLIVGQCAAYGYGYGRLLAIVSVLYVAGGLLYGAAAEQGGFAPSNPVIYRDLSLKSDCGSNWTRCRNAPPELPTFQPWIYAADIMLPVLDLGQKGDWQPADHGLTLPLPSLAGGSLRLEQTALAPGWLDVVVRTHTLLAWMALGLLLAIVTGLIKKE